MYLYIQIYHEKKEAELMVREAKPTFAGRLVQQDDPLVAQDFRRPSLGPFPGRDRPRQ